MNRINPVEMFALGVCVGGLIFATVLMWVGAFGSHR